MKMSAGVCETKGGTQYVVEIYLFNNEFSTPQKYVVN